MRLLSLLFLVFFLFTAPLSAQPIPQCPTASLPASNQDALDLGGFACVYVDDDRSLSLSKLLMPKQVTQLAPVPGGLVDFGFGASRYWVLVQLSNPSPALGIWWVTHDIPVALDLNVHLVTDDKPVQTLLQLTDQDGFAARPIAYRHLVSEIKLRPHETAILAIDFTSAQATEMPLFVETVPRFFERTQTEAVLIVALTALILGMGVISTVYLYGLDGRPALSYGTYVLGGIALLVHMEGYTFQYIWPNAPGVNQIALPIIALLSVALGILFVDRFTIARTWNPRLHRLAMFKTLLLLIVAGLSIPLIALVWFKNLILLVVCTGTLMQVVLAIAALRRGHPGARLLVLGFGALAASFVFGVIGYLTEGLFEQELAGLAIRLGFLTEATAFSAAIALRVRAARRERDASLREQLRLSEDRLSLSEALRRAEEDRQRAANAAQRSQQALASAAHDIRQPLASLQMALSSDDPPQERIARSLSYLDDIVRAGLEENNAPLGAGDDDPPLQDAKERFRADIVLKNIDAMFGSEARQKGVGLRVIPSQRHLVADPLAVMRILGNLVSNALQHGHADRILVGCRNSTEGLRFEVHDNGVGIKGEDLIHIRQRGHKGSASDGHGLGLAIAAELAEKNAMIFELVSWPGRGTIASLIIASTDRANAAQPKQATDRELT